MKLALGLFGNNNEETSLSLLKLESMDAKMLAHDEGPK